MRIPFLTSLLIVFTLNANHVRAQTENLQALFSKGGLHAGNAHWSTLEYDTIMDIISPKQPFFIYRNSFNKISQQYLNGEKSFFFYDSKHLLQKTISIYRGNHYINHFSPSGELIKKIKTERNTQKIYTYAHDTVIEQYVNPGHEVYLEKWYHNNQCFFTESTERQLDIHVPTPNGDTMHLRFRNTHVFHTSQRIDTTNLHVEIMATYYNGDHKRIFIQRHFAKRIDSIYTITTTQSGDTILLERGFKKWETHYPEFSTWVEKIQYPHLPFRYQKECWKHDDRQTKKRYNWDGKLFETAYLEYNKSPKFLFKKRPICGTPNMVIHEEIPGYHNTFRYFEVKGRTIPTHIKEHPQFSYVSFFYQFPPVRMGFYYKSDALIFPSEPTDILITEKGSISVQDLRTAFLCYLWEQKIKHHDYPVNHVMVKPMDKPWQISYSYNGKESTLEHAFLRFISSFGEIQIQPTTPRALIGIKDGKKQVEPYKLKEIWWEMEW